MDTQNKNTPATDSATPTTPVAKKTATPGKLPSKPISFSSHPGIQNGKKIKTSVDKAKKSGHLLKKLTGK